MQSPRVHCHSSTKKVTISPIMVAAPAPAKPMPKPNISSGSRRIFSTAPLARPYIDRLAKPWKRRMQLREVAAALKGMEMRIYLA